MCPRVRKGDEVKYFADGVLKWISRGEQFSTDAAEDSVGKPKVREDEEVKNAGGEIIKDILKKIEKDGSYLVWFKEDYQRVWISNGEELEEVKTEDE